MATPNMREYRRHMLNGSVLMGFAGVSFLLALLFEIRPDVVGVIIFAIVAMVFGSYAFDHFERGALHRPEDEPLHDLELFSSALKSGDHVNVHLQVLLEGTQTAHHTFDRIRVRLQRDFNMYLLQRDKLSDDPFTEIDALLQKSRDELQRELAIETLSLLTVGVKVTDLAHPKHGLYYGGR